MQGLVGITCLLLFQALGEILSRLLHLPLPGPVLGMLLIMPVFSWRFLREPVQLVAMFLLDHLALLYVPVGVGVVTQLGLLQHYSLRIALVLFLSTWLGLAVTAWVTQFLLQRQLQSQHEEGH